MSRFFAGGSSDSETSSSEEELYGSSSEESGSEDSEEESEENDSDESDDSYDSDSDDSADEGDKKKGASFFLRKKFLKGDVSDSDSESDDESKRVVKSAKDKLIDEIDIAIKAIDNAKKINDWVVISSGKYFLLLRMCGTF